VRDLFEAFAHVDERERSDLLQAAAIENAGRRMTRLHGRMRTRLAEALRELAAREPEPRPPRGA
jgi:hypothetical protein